MQNRKGHLFCWIIALGVTVIGCRDLGGRVPASGTVTLDNQPLDNGEIVFLPIAGTKGPTAAAEIIDGSFNIPAIKGPMPGTYRVEITAERKTGRKIQADEISSEMADQYEQYIPSRYNEDSDLTAEISKDSAPLSFELTF